MIGNNIPLPKKSTAGFGATVYNKSRLREMDSTVLNIVVTKRINGKDYNIEFIATDYLLDNKMYDITDNIYWGEISDYIGSVNYIVNKHVSTKKEIYGEDSVEVPQFFELFHEYAPIKENFEPIHFEDEEVVGDVSYLTKIIEYISKTPVCFVGFSLRFTLTYTISNDPRGSKDYFMNTGMHRMQRKRF